MAHKRDPQIKSATLVCHVHGPTEFRLYATHGSLTPKCVLCARERSARYYAEYGHSVKRPADPPRLDVVCQTCFLTKPCGCDD